MFASHLPSRWVRALSVFMNNNWLIAKINFAAMDRQGWNINNHYKFTGKSQNQIGEWSERLVGITNKLSIRSPTAVAMLKHQFPFDHWSQATLGLLVLGWVTPFPSAAGAVAELPHWKGLANWEALPVWWGVAGHTWLSLSRARLVVLVAGRQAPRTRKKNIYFFNYLDLWTKTMMDLKFCLFNCKNLLNIKP